MALIAAVFQVWLVATGTAMVTSTAEVATVISGRLRQTVQSLGAVYSTVAALQSIGTTTANVKVFQFVAFGIKNVDSCGA